MGANFFKRRKPKEPGPRRGRMLWTSIVMALAFLAVLVNAWYIQVNQNEHFLERSRDQHETTIKMTSRRGDILDRSGRELAVTAMMPSIFANPRRIEDPAFEAKRLAGILSGVDQAQLEKQLRSKRAFIWVKRHVSPTEADAIREMEQTADRRQRHKPVDIQLEPRRFYPAKGAAGALLGFTDVDGNGLEGMERRQEHVLRGKEYELQGVVDARGRRAARDGTVPADRVSGHSVETTIDLPIQQAAESALGKQAVAMGAKAALMIVQDPRTGDVLAYAQWPSFDPNQFRKHKPADWRNRSVTDVYEPGSVIKPCLVAAAIDAGVCRADSRFDGHNGRMRVGWKPFTDVHPVETVTPLETIQYSSNIGAIQIAQRLGKHKHHEYLRAFGFGARSGIDVAGEQPGYMMPTKRWKKVEQATISFGHGISTTPIQLVSAIGAIAHGGLLMKPRLIRRIVAADGRVVEQFGPRIVRRVVSEAAAKAATKGMILATTAKGGTSHRAQVPGYVVAGKTGTAHKIDPKTRGYAPDKYRSSFVGFVPADEPRLVAYVLFDEPTAHHYGGRVAAPVFAEVMRMALPYLGVKATEDTAAYSEGRDVKESPLKTESPRQSAWWMGQQLIPGSKPPITVPDIVGKSLSAAALELAELGLLIEADGAGLVISQAPEAGKPVTRKTTVAVALALPGDREVSQ